jgi:hypothetical protein
MSKDQPAAPRPGAVADHFVRTFGPDRLYFTVLPLASKGYESASSTFGSDNIEHLLPWLCLQEAKLASGSVATLAMVVRVFSDTRTVVVLGPLGSIAIPEKEVYGFRFFARKGEALSADEVAEAHMTDATSGEPIPPEPGVSFHSGAEILSAMSRRS